MPSWKLCHSTSSPNLFIGCRFLVPLYTPFWETSSWRPYVRRRNLRLSNTQNFLPCHSFQIRTHCFRSGVLSCLQRIIEGTTKWLFPQRRARESLLLVLFRPHHARCCVQSTSFIQRSIRDLPYGMAHTKMFINVLLKLVDNIDTLLFFIPMHDLNHVINVTFNARGCL